jgi:hypothetical protein
MVFHQRVCARGFKHPAEYIKCPGETGPVVLMGFIPVAGLFLPGQRFILAHEPSVCCYERENKLMTSNLAVWSDVRRSITPASGCRVELTLTNCSGART